MQIHTAVEHSSGIFSNGRGNQGLATWVVFNEVAHIVDDTGDGDQSLAVLGLLDEVIPVNDRKLLQWHTPVKLAPLLIKLLLLLLQPALVNLILAESLEVGGETKLLPSPDTPLSGVILVPDDGVAVIRRELVVKVVVSFAKGDEGSDDVVSRAVAVIKRLLAKPVGETVDAEGGLLDNKHTQDSGVDEATEPVAPAKTGDEGGEDESHEDDALHEVPVLPDNDGILVQVGDVGTTDSLGVLLHDHPANVAVEKTLPHGVGVLLSVGIPVVSTVTNCSKLDVKHRYLCLVTFRYLLSGPPPGRTFHGARSNSRKVDSEGQRCLVTPVCPESMVTSGDTETSVEVVSHSPYGSLTLKWHPVRGNTTPRAVSC